VNDEERYVLAALAGEHSYDRGTQRGNWFALWVFVFLPLVLAGVAESYLRGWQDVRVTPVLIAAGVLGAIAGAVWISTFNRTRYRIGEEEVVCVTPWPRRPWRLTAEEIEGASLEPSHGHWVLRLRIRGSGARHRLVLTKSMRERLGL
jgi:hypothetical protein